MVPEGSTASASDAGRETIESKPVEIGNDLQGIFSPRFKSAAAMAGWDEEALLIASLVVDDTPEREFRRKKRIVLQRKSPSTDSRRKRRTSPNLVSIPVAILDLDEEETTVKAEPPKQDPETETAVPEPKKSDTLVEQNAGASSRSALPCMDKLREELSCAICLEICFEPSTTPCGHSFCKKCLRSAADKCGRRCPKCRQLISNGRSCTVNTVLWNTIQLLFPQEIEARKEARGCSNQEKVQIPEKTFYSSLQTQETDRSSRHGHAARRRGAITTIQDEDGEELDSQTMRRAASSNADSSSSVQPRPHSRSIQPVRMTMTRDASSNADSRVQLRPHRRSVQPPVRMMMTRDADVRRSRGTPDQDQDAALALRLQREEFMEAFRDNTTQVQTRSSHSLSLARANLRAMASRAAINGRHL